MPVHAANEVAVDHHGVVGSLACDTTGGVGVLATAVFSYRIVVDHGIHIAGGDQKPQARLTEYLDGGRVTPIGLRDEAHLVAMRFEYTADDGSTKGGVIHVGVAVDVHEITLLPAARIHVGARNGQKRLACGAAVHLMCAVVFCHDVSSDLDVSHGACIYRIL